MRFRDQDQYHFWATRTDGTFGTGRGEEMERPPTREGGSHTPVWVPLETLTTGDVRPRSVAALLLTGRRPATPLRIVEGG